MQLAVRDALKKSPGHKISIAKAFKIAVKSKMVAKFAEELTKNNLKAILKHIVVRWNSELKTIISVNFFFCFGLREVIRLTHCKISFIIRDCINKRPFIYLKSLEN